MGILDKDAAGYLVCASSFGYNVYNIKLVLSLSSLLSLSRGDFAADAVAYCLPTTCLCLCVCGRVVVVVVASCYAFRLRQERKRREYEDLQLQL